MIWTFLQKLLKGVCSWETLQWGTLKGRFAALLRCRAIWTWSSFRINRSYWWYSYYGRVPRALAVPWANSWTSSGGSLADERCWFPDTCYWLECSVFFKFTRNSGSLWEWGLKNPQRESLFFIIFDISSRNNGQAFSGTFAPRLYNSYNHRQCPCARPAHVAESGPRAWQSHTPSAPKKWKTGSQMFMLRVKTLSVRDRHWGNQMEKN